MMALAREANKRSRVTLKELVTSTPQMREAVLNFGPETPQNWALQKNGELYESHLGTIGKKVL